MTITTFLWIIGAAILALGIAVFQYFYKSKYKTKRNRVYAFFRFLAFFGLLLMLINPKYKQVTYYTEKPSLAVAIDNSVSVAHLGFQETVNEMEARFRESEPLNNAFDIQYYSFGATVKALDSLYFQEKQTNITGVFKEFSSVYRNDIAPTVIVTDGNQTVGDAYQYASKRFKQPVYPLVVGDTVVYDELRLEQINVNRYAYINNKFPVEIFANYNGPDVVQSKLTIRSGGKTVHQENVRFSPQTSSQVFNVLLPANRVGVQQFVVSLLPLTNEKNTENNRKNFAIEVIDQKTNVLVISDMVHPDIGMLKKSIESNRLRTVTLAKPQESVSRLNDYQLVVLYQPNGRFQAVYKELNALGKNSITVTGSQTNWNVLNGIQGIVNREITGQQEATQGILNPNFSTFVIEDIGFSDFPPLTGGFGEVTFNVETDVALFQKIGGIPTEDPLLATTDENGKRAVYILGEGLWKWRAQSFRKSRSFQGFDNFIDNLIQYAASNKRKSRLNIDYDSFYYGNSSVRVYTQYFDKNYVFDNRAALTFKAIEKSSKAIYEAPFLLRNNSYEIDLSNLEPGEYNFTVTVENQRLTRSGSFTIVPFEVEQQFMNADVTSLRKVATNTEGALFTIANTDALIENLLADQRYKPIQKSNENIVSLIDWKWLLAIITALLAIEWFMRKYNGLT